MKQFSPFSKLHPNAGARLRSEIHCLHPTLLNPTHGEEHLVGQFTNHPAEIANDLVAVQQGGNSHLIAGNTSNDGCSPDAGHEADMAGESALGSAADQASGAASGASESIPGESAPATTPLPGGTGTATLPPPASMGEPAARLQCQQDRMVQHQQGCHQNLLRHKDPEQDCKAEFAKIRYILMALLDTVYFLLPANHILLKKL